MLELSRHLRSVTLDQLDAGAFFWFSARHEAKLRLSLLVGRSEVSLDWVELEGDRALTVFKSRADARGLPHVVPVPLVTISVGLPAEPRASMQTDTAGSLVFTPDGPHLVLDGKDEHGFSAPVYLSLSTWEVQRYLPDQDLTFTSWRLLGRNETDDTICLLERNWTD